MPNTTVATLQKKLRRKKVDAILISNQENRRYLSGFSPRDGSIQESSGSLLVPEKGRPLLLTDSRFQLQAEQECSSFAIHIYRQGLFTLLGQLLPALGVRTLGFEDDALLYSQAKALKKMCTKQGIQLRATQGLVANMRQQKTKEELAALKESVLLNEKVFQAVYKRLEPGMREIDIAIALETTMLKKGAERPSFDTIVASGPNGALPHATPSRRKIRKGEPIVIDMGLVKKGLCSDMTRTIVLGHPDKKTRSIFATVRTAQCKALALLRPGIPCKAIDAAARSFIAKKGYGDYFGHGLGHGVGYAIHEMPSLSPRSRKKLRPGNVITIEPGIYIPGWGGVRLENMAVITEKGFKVLNKDTTCLDLGFQ